MMRMSEKRIFVGNFLLNKCTANGKANNGSIDSSETRVRLEVNDIESAVALEVQVKEGAES